ncbi:MAG: class I SAM-dependent methyltransferase [Alphaproteobacteria bacterium]
MSKPDNGIVEHYTKSGLFERIIEALGKLGKTAGTIEPKDLKLVDEFHIGGIEATEDLLAQLEIRKSTQVLDIGSGIGGMTRHIVAHYGANVTGLDLTPEFVNTARRLTELVGLSAEFRVGSALEMPFNANQFDLATLMHVGMNLPDKPKLFAEVNRVLRPGGSFAVFDVMQIGENHPNFPLPWSSRPETSFLEKPETYLDAAAAAGFTLTARRDRGGFARDFFKKLSASLAGSTPPPLGLGLLMGEETQTKVGNMVAAVSAGDIAPVEMIFCGSD